MFHKINTDLFLYKGQRKQLSYGSYLEKWSARQWLGKQLLD